MRITIRQSLIRRCWRIYCVTEFTVKQFGRRYLHRYLRRYTVARHARTTARARITLSFRDTATLDWLRRLNTAKAADRVPPEVLVAQYMARMTVIASRGPLGMRGALIAACDLTDRLAAAVYTAQARHSTLWYGGAR